MKKVIVTGTEGYIGVILAEYLLKKGYTVTGVDTGFYKSGWLYRGTQKSPLQINKDIRNLTPEDVAGADVFIHLAELSNDPLGQLNPQITRKINHGGSVHLANICKKAGVPRFIYMSSCSVYGFGTDEFKTEESATNPQTEYAICKTLVEKDLQAMASNQFSPVFLRNATAYGISPRMRFDIVLNNLCGVAWTTGEIKMISDGMPWRPLVHILDICNAIHCCAIAPESAIHNQVFNVGNTEHNYRVKEIAEIVKNAIPQAKLSFGSSDPDNRSYRVSFEKIKTKLPGFSTSWTAEKGARQFVNLFNHIGFSASDFKQPSYTRLKELEKLIVTKQVNQDLFWNELPE